MLNREMIEMMRKQVQRVDFSPHPVSAQERVLATLYREIIKLEDNIEETQGEIAQCKHTIEQSEKYIQRWREMQEYYLELCKHLEPKEDENHAN
jgi:peptidoglycan hydrolase CwlO-like protein